MSLPSMQSFGRHMIKIYKYLSVIDRNKEMFVKFSDVLKPLYEQIKSQMDVGSLENRSQLSALSGMTNLVSQFDHFNNEIKQQRNSS